MTKKSWYIICTTPRSGSNLLCSYFEECKLLGRPAEFFNPRIVERGAYSKRFVFEKSVSLSDYISWLGMTFSSAANVVGSKLLYDDFNYLICLKPMQALFESALIVYLERRDKIKQAVSYFLAKKTGQWMKSDIGTLSRDAVVYDFEEIDQIHRMLIYQDQQWRVIFGARGSDIIHIVYEECLKDPVSTVQSVGTRLGLSIPAEAITTGMAAQTTERDQEFAQRYKSDLLKGIYSAKYRVIYENLEFAP